MPEKPRSRPSPRPSADGGPALLAGGNPQIPKGEGDGPVQAYIAAAPGWKQDVARRLDALIAETVPEVRKAVKWNTPLYGLDGRTWFAAFHMFTRYVKVTFFKGTALAPVPPEGSKHPGVRYLHVTEDAPLDEAQFVAWIRQAERVTFSSRLISKGSLVRSTTQRIGSAFLITFALARRASARRRPSPMVTR